MNVNASSSFLSVISLIVQQFKNIIFLLDGIIIIGENTSILDLNIALTVFGIIFFSVFSVVRSGAVNSVSSVSRSRSSRRNNDSSNKSE